MGMRPPTIKAPVFENNTRDSVNLSFEILKALLEGLANANLAYLKRNRKTPALYLSGVRYRPEASSEQWLMVPYVLAAKAGDCEDLASWRAAELNLRGIKAKPDVIARIMPDGIWRAHAIVRLPNGSIEDPSAVLGMPTGGM